MEENEIKKIYFIFSQKVGDNIHYQLEKNEIIDNIEILKSDKNANYSFALYSLSLNNYLNTKSFSILLRADNEFFIAQIDCYKIYPEIFLYTIEFKPMDKNSSTDINQIHLPVSEQFSIFKTHFNKEPHIIKYLLLNSFDYIAIENKEKKYEFYFYLYLFGNALYLNMENESETILSTFFNFFQLDSIDIKNSYKKSYHKNDISTIMEQKIVNTFCDFNLVYTLVSSILNEDSNKEIDVINLLDIILTYYYINFNQKMFFKFISEKENPRYNLTAENLKKNRKIFQNFSSEIVNFDLLDEAENLEEIHKLFLLVPDIPELIKIMADSLFFMKLCSLSLIEKKIVNIFKIVKPKKEDNMKLLLENFDILCKQSKDEYYAPFVLNDDLFSGYCDQFYQVNLNKMIQVVELYKKNVEYFPSLYKKNTFDELYNSYYDTGIHLINKGKLFNYDVIEFIEKGKSLFNQEIQITEEIGKGIIPSNDHSFLDLLINPKDEKLIILCKYYFEKCLLKDFQNLSDSNIFKSDNIEVFKYCYESLKITWLKEKGKINEILGDFIAHLFYVYFNYFNTDEEIDKLKIFEEELNHHELLMDIYGIVIKKYLKRFFVSGFQKHIYDYIEEHYKEVEVNSIYYKLLIIDEQEQENFLLNNLKIEYAIRLEDFINYPKIIAPRIRLFNKLYMSGFFLNKMIQNLEYYQLSIISKDSITSLQYKYAANITKNGEDFYRLFLFFIPNRINDDEDYLIASVLFDFNDLYDYCKTKYNSLKVLLTYLKHFFKIKKAKIILSLEELLKQMDDTPINQFNKLEEKIDCFLGDIDEAEKYDKLFNSFFFMGIYNNLANIFSNEEEDNKFQFCLMQFNEFKILGKNSNIDFINKELLNQLVELVYKNKDRLDDEINFIKEYFNFEDNPNFDYNRIKKSFLDKVNNYQAQENLEDYQVNFDNFNLIDDKINNKNNNIDTSSSKKNIKTDTDNGGFSIFGKDDEDIEDNEFCLFGTDENKSQKNEIKIDNEKKEILVKKEIPPEISGEELKIILKDLNLRKNEFYYILRIFKSYNDIEEKITFDNKYTNFFFEIFKNINKYEPLSNRQFYEKVIILSLQIFLSGVGINYFRNENNNQNDMYLINEFFNILEMYKKYNLLTKQKLFSIIEKLVEYKENENGEVINIIGIIENLFNEIAENIQKKSAASLFVKILCLEKNKFNLIEFNHKMIDFTFRNDNSFLISNITPLLDEIFKEEIKNKIDIEDDMKERNKYFCFQEGIYNPIEKMLNNSKEPKIAKKLEEIILYYFESKITNIFSMIKNKFEIKRDFYQNEDIKNYLQKSLFLLEEEFHKKLNINNRRISILFNIAFIKSFLNDYINYLYNFNQEIGNVKDINENIIEGNAINEFRTSIKLYVLKLFYKILGDYYDFFNFNYTHYQINYFQEEDIKNLSEWNENNEINNNKIKIYGFDYLFLPIKDEEIQELISIEKRMINICQNNNNDNDLITMVNHCSNMDIFLCSIINLFISNFKEKYYFDSNTYKNISSFLFDNLKNNKFIRINHLLKEILLFFIDIEKYENRFINNNEMNFRTNTLSYNQILSLSFSLRFVFNTIINNKEKSFLYQMLIGNENILTGKNTFIGLYNKEYSFYKLRNINQLTFTIIRFIILSHIYFGFLLNSINISNINIIFGNLEENVKLIDLMENDYELIKKILSLKGIKNIIVFMNYIFNDIKSIIANILSDNLNEQIIIDMETKIENEISKYLENFVFYEDEYYTMVDKMKNNFLKNNKFKNIITEEKKIYNESNLEKEYPYIKYFTLTNFCGFEDFKNQFLYLVNDKSNYPMINCLINNNDIIIIINNLHYINHFFNEINNDLMLKINRDEANKTIGMVLDGNIKNIINEFNEKINEINKHINLNNKIGEIKNDTKIIDIINIKDNSINKLFDDFIKIYNDFLTSTKIYKDNKKIIEPITIQEATKNDFIYLPVIKEKNNNDDYNPNEKTIYEHLNELLYLYSKRNRFYKNDLLNVSNGSKINYDFTQIENILEKEYLYGKKPFKTEQQTFIFSNEIFSNERNHLIEDLIEKYPQEEIKDNMFKAEIDKFFNDNNKTKNDFERIYINLQYLIIFVVNYKLNFNEEININNQIKKYNLDYISKILRKKNYLINELLSEFFHNYSDTLGINNLLFLYEKAEIKYFDYKSEEISKNVNIINNQDNFEKIEEYLKTNNSGSLLNEIALLEGTKKYIMRYCMGDYQDKNEIMKKIDLNKIFEKKSIWTFVHCNNEKGDIFKDEINKLLKLNEDNNNNLMNYILKKLFVSNKIIEEKVIKEDDDEDIKIRNRRRKRKRMEY